MTDDPAKAPVADARAASPVPAVVMADQAPPRQRRWLRWVWLSIVAAVVIGLGLALYRGAPVEQWLADLQAWLQPQGLTGAICLTMIIVVWSLLLPPAPFQVLCAVIYGLVGGMILFYIATTLTLLLVIGGMRLCARRAVARKLAQWPKLRVIEQALVHHGWRSVILLRLSGVVPSTLANPLLAASRLPVITILWASWVGKFPGILLLSLVGAAGGQLVHGGQTPESAAGGGPAWGTWVLLSVAIGATVLLTVIISRTARRLWQQELAEQATQSPLSGPAA